MLAAERPAQAENQIRCAVDEFAEAPHALHGVEVEVDPQVDTALAVVAVERAAIAVLGHESRELAQVIAQPRGRNAGIVPALKSLRFARNKSRRAQGRFTHTPHGRCVFGRINARRRRLCPALRGMSEGFSLGMSLSRVPCAHLHQQKPSAGRKERNVVHCEVFAPHEIDQQPVKSLQPDGAEFKHARHHVGGEEYVGKAQYCQHAEGRAVGQVERGSNDCGASAFGAHQRAGHVESVLVQ